MRSSEVGPAQELPTALSARALLDARRPDSLRYIHIKGHQERGSAFGHWNHVADRLCDLRRPVDRTVPLSAFGEPRAPMRSLATILSSDPADPGSTASR